MNTGVFGGLAIKRYECINLLLGANVVSTTATFVPISPRLVLRYETTGGFLIAGFNAVIVASTNTGVSIDLLVKGLRESIGGSDWGLTFHFGNSAHENQAKIIYPVGTLEPGIVELVPMIARGSGSSSAILGGQNYPCTLWIAELAGG